MAPPTQAPRDLDAGAIALVLLLSALWGGNTVAVKVGVADSPPLMLAALRFAIGGACVVGWGLWTRAPFRLQPGEGWPLLGLGLLFAIQLGLLNVGVWLSTAGHASVLLNAYPVYIVLLAHFLVPGDRLTVATLGGVVLGFAGILVLFAGQLLAPPEPGSTVLAGDVVLSVSAVLLALRQVILNRQLQRIHPVKPLLAQVVVGTPLFLLLSWGPRIRAHGPHLAPRRLALLPGCRDRGIQLHRQHVAPQDVPAQRTGGVQPDDPALRRSRHGSGHRRAHRLAARRARRSSWPAGLRWPRSSGTERSARAAGAPRPVPGGIR